MTSRITKKVFDYYEAKNLEAKQSARSRSLRPAPRAHEAPEQS